MMQESWDIFLDFFPQSEKLSLMESTVINMNLSYDHYSSKNRYKLSRLQGVTLTFKVRFRVEYHF